MRLKVCRLDQVPVGAPGGFAVPGLEAPVLLLRCGDRVLASASTCTHEEVSLLDGTVEGCRVRCPGHGYEFDLETGVCVRGLAPALRRYRVEVVDGDVWIDLLREP